MGKANNNSAYQPIKPHIHEPWNLQYGQDSYSLSSKALRKNLKRFIPALLWVSSVLSLYYFQVLVVKWLHLAPIVSNILGR